MKRLTVLLSIAVLILGFAVAPPAAAAVPTGGPASNKAGPTVFVAEVTSEQLGKVLASGIDRSEVVTSPGTSAGTVRVELVLGDAQARALVDAGVPLTEKQVRGTGAQQRMQQQSASGYQVFRSYSEPGGIRDEYLAAARDNPGLVKAVVIGTTVQGQDGVRTSSR